MYRLIGILATLVLFFAVAAAQAPGGTQVDPAAQANEDIPGLPRIQSCEELVRFLEQSSRTHFYRGRLLQGTETAKGAPAAVPAGNSSENLSNNLYVLDGAMQIVGKIEDTAPGERIYAVRFMGKKAYMVTFKNTDPLFVLDLADPLHPAVLGALKIPGFSNYLHPYDENHVIGIGKDTLQVFEKDRYGNVEAEGPAYEQGIKVALFDITDVTTPREKFAVRIGDRGTHSEVLDNHKALLFSREKNLLAFPVAVAEIRNKTASTPPWEHGAFTFQGAYVYELTLDKGFVLKERSTHRTREDYLKAGYDWCNSERDVRRVLYIGDTLYTLSSSLLKANDIKTLAEKRSLTLP
ncbi:MAG: beta-propeller domain-containing protein [Bacillota bacterium]